ncbi:hypothetical protein RR42_s1989 [Cupriavidus basilensis]|uniref:Uncharacterized protein n=1 Tax=Cupriavidus basilensis TaxID=68895 RepID=A0A0C4YD53_9BURK|nr:hypothetical protein RR42_s1989 [Cupriavidus basilensis]
MNLLSISMVCGFTRGAHFIAGHASGKQQARVNGQVLYLCAIPGADPRRSPGAHCRSAIAGATVWREGVATAAVLGTR